MKAQHSLADLTAAILVGGFGTRLRAVVADRPKVLAEIRGRPFLTYLFDQLVAAGVRFVVLCTGHLGEQIQAKFADSYRSLQLAYSQEPTPLGTAGALRLALPLCTSDSLLIMNGDSFCDVNLKDFWAWHCGRGVDGTLLLTEMADTKRYARVHVDSEGLVLSFDEKGDAHGAGLINAGIYLLKRCLLLTIPAGRAVSLEREMFPTWIGQALYGYRSEGRFLDIGTPETYALAKHFLRPGTPI